MKRLIYAILLLLTLPAMAWAQNEVLIKDKIEYSFQSASYSPTGNNDLSSGTPTSVALTLGLTGGVAPAGAMNSDKLNFGATRPSICTVNAAIEWFVAVSAGGTVDFYWSPSSHTTAAVGNAGHADGTDGDYTGDGGGTIAESVQQMQPIGSLVTTDLIGVQIGWVGHFAPLARYGQLVVVNNSSAALAGTDDIETSVLMTCTVLEVQP